MRKAGLRRWRTGESDRLYGRYGREINLLGSRQTKNLVGYKVRESIAAC